VKTIVQVEPEHVNAKVGAAILDVCERSFHKLVADGYITKINIPGMRRTTYSLKQIRGLAALWRERSAGGNQHREDAAQDVDASHAAV